MQEFKLLQGVMEEVVNLLQVQMFRQPAQAIMGEKLRLHLVQKLVYLPKEWVILMVMVKVQGYLGRHLIFLHQ
jgi:hypothetical protein